MFITKNMNKKLLVLLSCALFCLLLASSTPGNAQFPFPWAPIQPFWAPIQPLPIFNPILPAPLPSPLATVHGAEATTFVAPTDALTIPAAYIWLSLADPPVKLTALPVPTTIYIVPPLPPSPLVPSAPTDLVLPITTVVTLPPPIINPATIVTPIQTTPVVTPITAPVPTLLSPTIVNVLPPTPVVPPTTIAAPIAPTPVVAPIAPITTVAPAAVSALGGLIGFTPFQSPLQPGFGFNPFFNPVSIFNPFGFLF